MSVNKIGFSNQVSRNIAFKADNSGKKTEYENPVSRQTERNLAILSSSAESAVAGAVVYGLVSCLTKNKTTKFAAGVGTALGVLAITLPPALYNRKVSAFVKSKEMDVFSRDRNLKSNLTEEVDTEVQDKNVSLDKKLDDNLKLQMANRGSAIGLANITPQQ